MLRPYYRAAALQRPLNGRLAMPFELDFSVVKILDFDIAADLMNVGGIGFVQGAFIDNGAAREPLTIKFFTPANQGFVLRIAGKVQAWMPLPLPFGSVSFEASLANLSVIKPTLDLVNFPVSPILWNVP